MALAPWLWGQIEAIFKPDIDGIFHVASAFATGMQAALAIGLAFVAFDLSSLAGLTTF